MTERDALLRAVCDNPDDDTPRLVFADWLQENGEEARAEFIRFQCQAARLPAGSSARQHKDNRINFLLRQHGPTWSRELPNAPGHRWGESFVRGFVADLTVFEPPTERTLETCFDASPITSLVVTCRNVQWKQLCADGYLLRLSELTIDSANASDHAGALCELGPWPRLARLVVAGAVGEEVRYIPIDPATADALREVYGDRLRLPPRGYGR